MQTKSLSDLQENYDLELERIVKTIKAKRAKRILIQLPDGLKPYATELSSELEKRTSSSIFIWLDSCFGACDIPTSEAKSVNIDLIVQFGHSPWEF